MQTADVDLTKEELEAEAAKLTGGAEVEWLSSGDVARLITIGQYLTDRCLAEIEKRGELEMHDGIAALPYHSDHVIETILTRDTEAPVSL